MTSTIQIFHQKTQATPNTLPNGHISIPIFPYIIVFEFLLLGIFPQRASYRGVSLQFEMFQAWEEKGYYAKLFTWCMQLFGGQDQEINTFDNS